MIRQDKNTLKKMFSRVGTDPHSLNPQKFYALIDLLFDRDAIRVTEFGIEFFNGTEWIEIRKATEEDVVTAASVHRFLTPEHLQLLKAYTYNQQLDSKLGDVSWGGEGSLEIQEDDPVFLASEAAKFVEGDKAKLDSVATDKYYRHVQNMPSKVWSVTHNLNKKPSVMVTDTAGTLVEGEIKYIDNNNLVITFSANFSGYAELN